MKRCGCYNVHDAVSGRGTGMHVEWREEWTIWLWGLSGGDRRDGGTLTLTITDYHLNYHLSSRPVNETDRGRSEGLLAAGGWRLAVTVRSLRYETCTHKSLLRARQYDWWRCRWYCCPQLRTSSVTIIYRSGSIFPEITSNESSRYSIRIIKLLSRPCQRVD